MKKVLIILSVLTGVALVGFVCLMGYAAGIASNTVYKQTSPAKTQQTTQPATQPNKNVSEKEDDAPVENTPVKKISSTDTDTGKSTDTPKYLVYEDDYVKFTYPTGYTLKGPWLENGQFQFQLGSKEEPIRGITVTITNGVGYEQTGYSEENVKNQQREIISSLGGEVISIDYEKKNDFHICKGVGSIGNEKIITILKLAKSFNINFLIGYDKKFEDEVSDLIVNHLDKIQIKDEMFNLETFDTGDIADYLLISDFSMDRTNPSVSWVDTSFTLTNNAGSDLSWLSVRATTYNESGVLIGEYYFDQVPSTIKAGSAVKIRGSVDIRGAAYGQIVIVEGFNSYTSDKWVFALK